MNRGKVEIKMEHGFDKSNWAMPLLKIITVFDLPAMKNTFLTPFSIVFSSAFSIALGTRHGDGSPV